jgi:hypothetical protein
LLKDTLGKTEEAFDVLDTTQDVTAYVTFTLIIDPQTQEVLSEEIDEVDGEGGVSGSSSLDVG